MALLSMPPEVGVLPDANTHLEAKCLNELHHIVGQRIAVSLKIKVAAPAGILPSCEAPCGCVMTHHCKGMKLQHETAVYVHAMIVVIASY